MLGIMIFTKTKAKLSDYLMMGGLLLMTFMSLRHVSFLGIIGMFYLCRLVSNIGYIKTSKPLDFELPGYSLFIVLVTIIITSGLVYNVNSSSPMTPFFNNNSEISRSLSLCSNNTFAAS